MQEQINLQSLRIKLITIRGEEMLAPNDEAAGLRTESTSPTLDVQPDRREETEHPRVARLLGETPCSEGIRDCPLVVAAVRLKGGECCGCRRGSPLVPDLIVGRKRQTERCQPVDDLKAVGIQRRAETSAVGEPAAVLRGF